MCNLGYRPCPEEYGITCCSKISQIGEFINSRSSLPTLLEVGKSTIKAVANLMYDEDPVLIDGTFLLNSHMAEGVRQLHSTFLIRLLSPFRRME
jgi:hypothetical protein